MSDAMDWVMSALLVAGALFIVLGGIGLLRLPDVYLRLSAAAKAGTLGISCILLAAALHFRSAGLMERAIGIIAFLFLTAPISAHMIGRAAWLTRVGFWGTRVNDLDAEPRPEGPRHQQEPGRPPPGAPAPRTP
jgi:multicomponent Na+:H+ antiporter subunit G